MPTPEPSAAQEILNIASVVLLLGGGLAVSSGLGVLKSRRGRRPSKPSGAHLALGLAMLVGGGITMSLKHDPAPETETITSERFFSSQLPSIAVTAPPPWRLEHDVRAGRLVGTRPGAKLMMETSFITDVNDAPSALDGVFRPLTQMGLEPAGEPFIRWFDGLQAWGRIGTAGLGSSAVWVAERPGKLFTVFVCTSETGHDAQTACDSVLTSLNWRPPPGSR
jgi:hypothetical protein